MWYDFSWWHPLWYVILGGVVGWLAGRAFRGPGLGLPGNVAVGIGGAVLGGLLFYSDMFWDLVDLASGDRFHETHPLDFAGFLFFGYMLWTVILGALVGWLVGRAFLGFGCLGNVVLAVIGAVAGHLFFGSKPASSSRTLGRPYCPPPTTFTMPPSARWCAWPSHLSSPGFYMKFLLDRR